jgi:murein DD-endopeptidase MepM/ murein hydrolase activator NlpD
VTLPKGTRRNRHAAFAVVLLATLAMSLPTADAQLSGGAGMGGAYASAPPAITSIVCNTNCAGLDKVKTGSVLQVAGLRMASARKVEFRGRAGKRDDVTGTVLTRTDTLITVRVPAKAKTGKLRVFNADGNKSKPSPKKVTVVRKSVAGKKLEARAEGRRTFVFNGLSKTALRYFIGAKGAAQVQITLVRKGDPVALTGWTQNSIPPGSVRTVAWDGRVAGLQAADGTYEFHIRATGNYTSAKAAQSGGSNVTARFKVLSYAFPILGEHKYGTGAARYGAKRGSGTHEGQDVFAKCGTPMVAARGGVVLMRGYDSRGGNYLVIDGDSDSSDFAYMHLKNKSPFAPGSRMKTGDQIGQVGQTGDADGCHLHFEDWPSGYQKGHTIDPQPLLKSWDK